MQARNNDQINAELPHAKKIKLEGDEISSEQMAVYVIDDIAKLINKSSPVQTKENNQKRYYFINQNEVSAETLKSLVEEGKGKHIKRFVIDAGEKKQIFTKHQIFDNRFVFSDKSEVPEIVLKTLKQTGKGRALKRFVTVDGEEVQIFTRQQIRLNRIVFADKTDVPDQLLKSLRELNNGGHIKRYVTKPDGQEVQVYSLLQLSKNRLVFADKTDVPNVLMDTLNIQGAGCHIKRFVTVDGEEVPVFTRDQMYKRKDATVVNQVLFVNTSSHLTQFGMFAVPQQPSQQPQRVHNDKHARPWEL